MRLVLLSCVAAGTLPHSTAILPADTENLFCADTNSLIFVALLRVDEIVRIICCVTLKIFGLVTMCFSFYIAFSNICIVIRYMR